MKKDTKKKQTHGQQGTTKAGPSVPSILDRNFSTKSVPMSRKSNRSIKSVVVHTNEANQYEHPIAVPPDGGWGWVIVIIAFISYFLMDGVCYTFGIFLAELAESFNKSVSDVAMISSYMTGVYYLTGPIACALCNHLGFRLVGFFGALMSSGLFLAASFLENFVAFTVLVGFGLGFSFDMVYTVMLLDVGFYFERYRALATSVSVLGVSAGIMGFPPIFRDEHLLGSYDWRTKFRFISGAFLILTTLTLGLRPLKHTIIVEEGKLGGDFDADSIGTFDIIEESETGLKRIRNIFERFHNSFYPTVADYTSEYKYSRRNTEETSTFLAILPELTSNDDDVSSVARSVFSTFSHVSAYRSALTTNKSDDVGCCSSLCCYKCCRCSNCCPGCCARCQTKCDFFCGKMCCRSNNINRPMYRDDILYQFGSLSMLPEYNTSKPRINVKPASSATSKRLDYHLTVSRVVTQKDIEEARRCVCCPEAVLRVLATMLDLNLFKSVSFTLLIISSFLTMVGLYVPFVFMVERGEELHLEGQWPTTLLSIMGLANCAGRVACGLVSFFPWMSPMIISYMTLIVGGAAILATSCWISLAGQLTGSIIFGFCVASFTTLRTVLLASMFGLENLTNAFGITILFYGLASFVGIPAASYMRQYTGTYQYCFVMAGSALLVSGLVMIPIEKINTKEQEKFRHKVQFNV